MQCSQCGRPAMYVVGQHPLCVEHFLAHQQALAIQQRESAAMINYLKESMEVTSGLPPGTLGRFPMPQPVVHTDPATVHNIRVDRSIVGAINTGAVQRLNVALDRIQQGDDPEVAATIHALTAAILQSHDLSQDSKGQAVEQLSYLAGQAALPAQHRERSVATVVLQALRSTLAAAADLASIWGPASVLLAKLFS